MSSSVGFRIPFLRSSSSCSVSNRKQKHSRLGDDDRSVMDSSMCSSVGCQSQSVDESGLDESHLYPISSSSSICNSSQCSSASMPSRYDHLYLQRKFSGNPLLPSEPLDDMDDHRVCRYDDDTATSVTSSSASEMMVWSCQYCDSALFRTEHETMIHELTCSHNTSGPFVKSSESISIVEDHHKRGRHVAQLLLRKSSASRSFHVKKISKRKSNKNKNHPKHNSGNHQDDNHSTSRRDVVSVDKLVPHEESLLSTTTNKHKHKKKSGRQLVRTVRNITRRNKNKKDKTNKTKASNTNNLDDYFSRQKSGVTRGSGHTSSLLTDDVTMESADSTYELSSADNSPKHEQSSCHNNHHHHHQVVVDRIPLSLCRRPSSEELMDRLGMKNEGSVRSAMETLRSRSSSSLVDDNDNNNDDDDDQSTRSMSSSSSWADDHIQGIRVPNYAQYVELAITAFRRDVLNISDDLYLTFQSVAYRMISPKLSN